MSRKHGDGKELVAAGAPGAGAPGADVAARRVQTLATHLDCAGAGGYPALVPNHRPGDDEVDPVETSFFVEGSFEPRADELTQRLDLAACTVEGAVPAGLRGTFLRIGPNPHFDFRGKPYHVFDGDGMIHSVAFDGGGETGLYQNRWVRTKAFEREMERGFSFSIMGEAMQMPTTGNSAWMAYAKSIDDIGRANTAMVWHRDRLMALFEQDNPYEVDLATLETAGRVEAFGGIALKYPTFTAHPKVCPATGDLVFFGYINGPKTGPWLHYGVVDRTGALKRSFPVTIPAPVMMHDCAITANYALFYDYNNMYNSPGKLMRGDATHMYEHDASKKARFGVLPRDAESEAEIVWIECFTGSSVFHFANAWEEADGEHIRVYGSAAAGVDVDALENIPAGHMHLWRLNVRTGRCVEERDIAPLACDFPQVPTDCVGRRCRYAYAAHFIDGFSINGVIKFDLQEETYTVHLHAHGSAEDHGNVMGGECMFARRSDAAEDDGWLLTFTYGDDRCPGSLDIVDARTMQPVARVAMPARVPAGFHALWIQQ